MGGEVNHDFYPADTKYVDAYSLISKQWIEKQNLTKPRSHAEASTLVVENKIIMLAGRNNYLEYREQVQESVVEYDPATDTWTDLPALPRQFFGPAAGYFSGIEVDNVNGSYIVIACGGVDYNQPRNNTYIAKISFNCTHHDHETETSTGETSSTSSSGMTTENSGTTGVEEEEEDPLDNENSTNSNYNNLMSILIFSLVGVLITIV